MITQGTVQGAAARRYPEFTWRKPVLRPITTIWDLDPERLTAADPYPRSVNPPSAAPAPYVELVDYEVRIGSAQPTGLAPVSVWLVPNEYTQSKVPRCVLAFEAANAFVLRDTYIDEAVCRAFKP